MKEAKILMGPHSYRLIELSNLVCAFQPLHKLASGGDRAFFKDFPVGGGAFFEKGPFCEIIY